MALIECPECKEKVSDKALVCIHCGFPLENFQNKNYCKINTEKCDLADLKKFYDELSNIAKLNLKKSCINIWNNISLKNNVSDYKYYNSSLHKQNMLFNKLLLGIQNDTGMTKNVSAKFLIECINHNFEYFEFNTADYAAAAPKPAPQPDPKTVRCPKCGSTSVTTQERGYSIMWGVLGSTKKKNLCQKCGYTWWPGAGK